MSETPKPYDEGHGKDPLYEMLNRPPVCELCGDDHWPNESHDSGSIMFHRNFEKEHGRPPTYRDAFAHCSAHEAEIALKVILAYGKDPDGIADLDGL